MNNTIQIEGAKVHNLRNLDIKIPREKLVVITGVSGSGKSTLAFDTIYSEGQRKYVESLSAYARQFLQMMNKPDVDAIEGLSPAISIEQKTTQKNPRSTVGTVTEIYDYLRVLFARVGIPYSPTTGLPIKSQTVSEICDNIINTNKNNKAYIEGNTKFIGAEVMSSDLRASVALVLAASVAQGKSVINRIYHLDRGYEKVENRNRLFLSFLFGICWLGR